MTELSVGPGSCAACRRCVRLLRVSGARRAVAMSPERFEIAFQRKSSTSAPPLAGSQLATGLRQRRLALRHEWRLPAHTDLLLAEQLRLARAGRGDECLCHYGCGSTASRSISARRPRPRAAPMPLVLTHGWRGRSGFRYRDRTPHRPSAHGGDPRRRLRCGGARRCRYAFSDATGDDRHQLVAHRGSLVQLMRDVLATSVLRPTAATGRVGHEPARSQVRA